MTLLFYQEINVFLILLDIINKKGSINNLHVSGKTDYESTDSSHAGDHSIKDELAIFFFEIILSSRELLQKKALCPKPKFKFDRDALAEFIQNEYNMSKEYIVDSKSFPTTIPYDEKLDLVEFETELLLDDHIVTVNSGDRVLGVFATELDFEHIIKELV